MTKLDMGIYQGVLEANPGLGGDPIADYRIIRILLHTAKYYAETKGIRYSDLYPADARCNIPHIPSYWPSIDLPYHRGYNPKDIKSYIWDNHKIKLGYYVIGMLAYCVGLTRLGRKARWIGHNKSERVTYNIYTFRDKYTGRKGRKNNEAIKDILENYEESANKIRMALNLPIIPKIKNSFVDNKGLPLPLPWKEENTDSIVDRLFAEIPQEETLDEMFGDYLKEEDEIENLLAKI